MCHGTPHGSVGWHGFAEVGGCCCGGQGMRRRFFSKDERLARLRDYLDNLRAEAQQVERAIQELEASK